MHVRCVLCIVAGLTLAARAGEDAPAPRPIEVLVDASEPWSGLIKATVNIPVKPGPVRLYYPKWAPTLHAESDGIRRVSYFSVLAGSVPIEWRRDEKDACSFLCTVPEAASTLTVTLALAVDAEQDDWNWESGSTGSVSLISWSNFVLYPAGEDIEQMRARGCVRIPDGWQMATSLVADGAAEVGRVRFREVSLRELMDSPVAAGRRVRSYPLSVSTSRVPHVLAVVSEREMPVPDDVVDGLGSAIEEAHAVLGAPPMDRYTFLVVAGETIAGGGREHLRSSITFADPAAFREDSWGTAVTLVHEYVHAWNGKRHLPAGMRVRDFQEPPDFRLVWVYEGLTTYLSYVIGTRSGLWDDERFKWALAREAVDARREAIGGAWRSLEDVCATVPLHMRELPWQDRRREEAHYGEAALLWMEIDCLLRSRTDGKLSLDDFCRRFFGREAKGEIVTYDWDTLVETLSSLVDMDWSGFLRERVRATDAPDRLAGIQASGWRVVLRSAEPWIVSSPEYRRHGRSCVDLSLSIGAIVASDGTVLDVTMGGALETVHVGPATKIVKVNGKPFALLDLVDAVGNTERTRLRLVVSRGGETRELELDYDGGHRVASLARLAAPDLLARIAAPLRRE